MCVRHGGSAQHEPLAVAIEEVDEASMGRARVRKQPDDALENLFEVEGRPDRRDDLVEEAFFDCCRRLPCGDPSILLVGRREWKGRVIGPGASCGC
jgi:hypothetical protein